MIFPLPFAALLSLALNIYRPSPEVHTQPGDMKDGLVAATTGKCAGVIAENIGLSPQTACCILKAGTPIKIEIMDSVSSETSVRGSKFRIRLSESIMDGENVIVPSGATGIGEVIDSHPAGYSGKPAELVLAARYIEYHGVKIPIRKFKILVTGQNQTNSAMVVGLAFGVVGALVKGGEIVVPAGTKSDAIIAVDTNINRD